MAKNDYFVIAYKVLKYLYGCLKGGVAPDIEFYNAESCGINEAYWHYIMVNLYEGGYITDVVLIPPTLNHPDKGVRVSSKTKITPLGIQYLDENSMFKKVKETVKDIAEIIPL